MRSNRVNFFASIVIPSALAILLFIIGFFLIIIPQFEANLLNGKKETIKELTQSAWSVLNQYQEMAEENVISVDEAKKQASEHIEKMRYGKDRKDYFWIIDLRPVMIMHPYRKALENKDLSDYEDSHGKKLFVEAARKVEKSGEGFIDYYWQWKDDTSRIVPKLSFVKGFEPWGWAIGTGIYLEDVRSEMLHLKKRLFLISAGILIIIILIWVYVIRQSHTIEKSRKSAEQNLRLSRQKYKSLVEASNDGTLMVVDDRIIYYNLKFVELMNMKKQQKHIFDFDKIFSARWIDIKTKFDQNTKTDSFESKIIMPDNKAKDVIINISKIDYAGRDGYILIIKDVSAIVQAQKESEELNLELQMPLILMNQPINAYIQQPLQISMNTTIKEAAAIMKKQNQDVAFITHENSFIGVINHKDLTYRVISEEIKITAPVTSIMTAPLQFIDGNALLFQAIEKCRKHNVSHLVVQDFSKHIIGVIGKKQLLNLLNYWKPFLLKETARAETIGELTQIFKKIPILINALIQSGTKQKHITYTNASIADAIHKRVIDLAIEKMGEPPVDFSFIVLGSQGRMEETLYTDQDNAIIFEDSPNVEKHADYFHRLAIKINDDLHNIGYRRCPGDVMAVNPKWCQPVSVWKDYFTQWTKVPEPQSVLESSIFFDFRCVYGKSSLSDELQKHLQIVTNQNGLFFFHMADSLNKFKVSLNNENIDLKKIVFPLVASVRLYSLFYSIDDKNTHERMVKLKSKISQTDFEELKCVYDFIMFKRLEIQAKAVLNHEIPDNVIDVKRVNKAVYKMLEYAVSSINECVTGVGLNFKR